MAVFNVKQTSIQRKPKIIRFIYELVLSVKTITINEKLVNKTKKWKQNLICDYILDEKEIQPSFKWHKLVKIKVNK